MSGITLDDICIKCGVSLRRECLIALMMDCGATSNKQPHECPCGGDHDFQSQETTNPQ
jgi:hypothetical protein